jgi:cellulose synthase operon protein B
MIRPSLLALSVLAATLAPVLAQPTPFDMSPESDLVTPDPEPAPVPNRPAAEPAPEAEPTGIRYLVPAPELRLEGEEARETAAVYLTEAEAAAPARLEFSYLNSVVVAPEVSSLLVRINGTQIAATPLAASSAPATIALDVPAGLLRAGANTVDFRATQRHRTDCTIQSTYELWTAMPGQSVRLAFGDPSLDAVTRLPDLSAVGVDSTGTTTVRLISGNLADPAAATAAVRLAQHLAIALRIPALHIERAGALSETAEPGVLDVVLMPAGELPAALAAAQAQAASGPLAAMMTLPSGAATLLVSGPEWAAIGTAVDAVANAAPAAPDRPRIDLAIPHPVMGGASSVSLADLGLETIEFNGRRLTADLQFDLPADFYAYRYGEVELVLDAAYSADVLPGSEIDIYTNGQIASATPLLRTDGGTLRDSVIRIPMTNLRSGRNEVRVDVNLNAASDAVCSAGWTGQAPVRFVLGNSSQLRFPNYARVAAVPDLQVLAGSGWPYAEETSVPMVLGSGDDTVLSAMMFAARIASASDRVLPFAVTPEANLAPTQHAVLVMPWSELSAPVRARANLLVGTGAPGAPDRALDQFGTSQPTGPLAGPAQWIADRLGLRLADLRILPRPDAPFHPEDDQLVVTQSRQGEGGIWTMVTAADGANLRSGVEDLIDTVHWRQLAGRVSARTPEDEGMTVIQPNTPFLVESRPLDPFNLRLIAANWFSGNILYFTGAVALLALLLSLASARVLAQLGRRH